MTEVEKMMAVVEKEKIEKVEPKKAIVMADEAEANKAAAAAKVIKDECEAALAVAMPVLNEALAALDTLSANDINYVKKLANPPYLIKLVLEAVCVILEAKPAKVPDGKGGQLLDYWKPSVTLLNDKNFLQNLKVKSFSNEKGAFLSYWQKCVSVFWVCGFYGWSLAFIVTNFPMSLYT